mmetsp:Transcript_57947/g.147251  ORF Transcript_57947/g.147251 Transcript_57947/m.147251 type:complete len:306 (+) Transcript_57947:377-1294(+)
MDPVKVVFPLLSGHMVIDWDLSRKRLVLRLRPSSSVGSTQPCPAPLELRPQSARQSHATHQPHEEHQHHQPAEPMTEVARELGITRFSSLRQWLAHRRPGCRVCVPEGGRKNFLQQAPVAVPEEREVSALRRLRASALAICEIVHQQLLAHHVGLVPGSQEIALCPRQRFCLRNHGQSLQGLVANLPTVLVRAGGPQRGQGGRHVLPEQAGGEAVGEGGERGAWRHVDKGESQGAARRDLERHTAGAAGTVVDAGHRQVGGLRQVLGKHAGQIRPLRGGQKLHVDANYLESHLGNAEGRARDDVL